MTSHADQLKVEIDRLQAEHGRSCGSKAFQLQQMIDIARQRLVTMQTENRYPGLGGEPPVPFGHAK